MNLHNVKFIKSTAAAKGLIIDDLPQIVFSGKSNVGKSSVINKLLNRKNIARVSSRPGKTIHINYFLIDELAYFVDLPGYGYARVAKTEQARWGKLMEVYFSAADHIALGVMIVDARHPPTKDDIVMAQWFKATDCRMVIIANKIDKVKSSEKIKNMDIIREVLGLSEGVKIIPFSAEKGTNKEELISDIFDAVERWRDA